MSQNYQMSNKATIYTALLIALAVAFVYWGTTENVEPLIIKGLGLALVIMAFAPIFFKSEEGQNMSCNERHSKTPSYSKDKS
jgi:hypothetical protein